MTISLYILLMFSNQQNKVSISLDFQLTLPMTMFREQEKFGHTYGCISRHYCLYKLLQATVEHDPIY